MKKLLTIAALTALTATSAFATSSHQGWRAQEGWRAQAMQSYASSDDMVVSPRYQDDMVVSPRYQTVSPRDSSTRTYFGHFGPQNSGSSIVQ